MDRRNITVIGASAGGFEALKTLAARLPADLDASIFIVWHLPADVCGILPQVLNRVGPIGAVEARGGYVARGFADRHCRIRSGWQ